MIEEIKDDSGSVPLPFGKQTVVGSTVILGDCVEVMKGFSDNQFDLAIVDPPYGIDRNGMEMGNSVFNKDEKEWDKSVPNKEYFDELFRVSKNQIIWGGNYFELPVSRYFAIWDKGETMYGRDFAECEMAWVRFGGTRIYKKNPNQPDRIHPTQKPIQLYKWVLKKYAKSGDKILDTHLGSGSSRIAADVDGFDFTGIEIDKEYFDLSEKRFKLYKSQLRIEGW
jgi:site-specific DNA-methyltransferase (adenine-specific)